jgi:hypothetical protein
VLRAAGKISVVNQTATITVTYSAHLEDSDFRFWNAVAYFGSISILQSHARKVANTGMYASLFFP